MLIEKSFSFRGKLKCVFITVTLVASNYANLSEQKEAFTLEKSSTPTGLVWNTKMSTVTPSENTAY